MREVCTIAIAARTMRANAHAHAIAPSPHRPTGAYTIAKSYLCQPHIAVRHHFQALGSNPRQSDGERRSAKCKNRQV